MQICTISSSVRQVKTLANKIEEYSEKLKSLKVSFGALQETLLVFEDKQEEITELTNPSVNLARKRDIVDEVIPQEAKNFVFYLAQSGEAELFPEIAKYYMQRRVQNADALSAQLIYVTPPTKEQLNGITDLLSKKYNKPVLVRSLKDESIGSGFIIRIGADEYDWSEKGRLDQLKSHIAEAAESLKGKAEKPEDLIAILKGEISDFELEAKDREIGEVIWVGDGIATIAGLDHAEYGEIVIFECGVRGMVQDIRRDNIGVILFGQDREVKDGSRVVRTGKTAGIPVGDAFLGRVVDALGAPIDGEGEIKATGYRPIENPAPGIVDRESVSVPLETGILSIDSMFPIGRGQRELIIGDRQTGKTSIAIDTIINQKDKNVICVYVAIGQKASTIAKLRNTLKKEGALDYTIIVAATAADPAPLQYIAPYAGCALAENFMYQGKDVLIVYDDLSKHAVAYRAISLLLERPPGREAYPGDVFYLHSRLLERSSRLTPEAGGGSITALPIIETQAGDVSAYIPTNVISITDGQIFLESDLFFSGQRPAVNVGLSVSRVGGAAQSKAMKKAAGSIRIDLAQYREMEVFTQFSSDLDDETKAQLAYGAGLMQLLKQPLCHPLSMPEQVITLVAATARIFADVKTTEVKPMQMAMLDYFAEKRSDLINRLRDGKVLTDEIRE
ncbi:MAG: F0F1 ATP synthase subunit alpha, partial [Lachnospiraceae bacterium]|nr:F0F1 ATP synthase subunit alpha [Lachnospiraceae bacterium]